MKGEVETPRGSQNSTLPLQWHFYMGEKLIARVDLTRYLFVPLSAVLQNVFHNWISQFTSWISWLSTMMFQGGERALAIGMDDGGAASVSCHWHSTWWRCVCECVHMLLWEVLRWVRRCFPQVPQMTSVSVLKYSINNFPDAFLLFEN